MREPGWLAALAAVVLTTNGTAAEPRIGKFVAYDAGGFTVITSRGANQARQFIEDLAKYRVTLERTLARHATNTAIPTQILIVSDSDWHKYLEPRAEASRPTSTCAAGRPKR